MQKLTLSFVIFFALLSKTFAQCPLVSFTVPDSSCASSINFINTTVGPVNYFWDFCPGDLSTAPTGINIGNFGATFSYPNQTKIIKDNGNYYVFITNYLGALTRLDYGNSLENPSPGIFTYSYSGFANPFGIDIIKDGTNWYALLTDDGNSHLFRLDLGTTISNNIFSFTDLGLFAYDLPVVVKLLNDNGNYYAFVTDRALNNITKYYFGSSITNAIISSSTLTDPSFQSPYGIDITYDCTTNKYIGFVANYGVSSVSVIDFGNSISNAGAVTHTLTSPFAGPTNINLLRDGDQWNLLFTCQDVNSLAQLRLGNNLLTTTPSAGFTGNIGNMNLPRGLSCVQDSSRWYGIIVNTLGQDLTRIKFENNCTASVSTSVDSTPQNIFYSGIGWQSICLTASNNGYTGYFTDSTYSNGLPCVDFSYTSACENQLISFTDNSSTGQGTITSWQWDFGDGSPLENSQNPVHTFTNDSTFLVTLSVTASNGLSSSYSTLITVHKIPNAGFNFTDNQCENSLVSFTDISSASPGDNITSWEWNFGDGSPITTFQNPLYEFDAASTYSVQLIVYSNTGCSDTVRQNITILPAANSSFSISQTCAGETTLFTNTTDTSGAGTVNYQWNFGDSGTSLLESPSHSYSATPSTYTVQLIATSANNCKDTLETSVRISSKANPGFSYSPTLACIGNTVQFIDTSSIASGDTIVLRTWDFGDASGLATGDTVNHSYNSSGTFNVTLTVTSLTSCDTFITRTVTVIESPFADFSFVNVCLDSTIHFADLSSTPAGTVIDSILWDFGDNSSDTGTVVTHTYIAAGTYNVIHTVLNSAGCYGTITLQVTVYEKPLASFTSSPAFAGDIVSFTNSSSITDPADSIVSSIWDFGGTFSLLENPTYIFPAIGSYPVELAVTSAHGCQDSITNSVQVNASIAQCAVANFSVTDTVCAGLLSLANLSVGASDYLWDFCAGDLDTIPTGSNLGSSAGLSFPNQVKVVNDNGNYFVFVTNYLGAITRFDFGTSLENPAPATFTYTYSGFGNPYGIDVVKDGNHWYAIITDDGNSHMFRLDLGTIISNNIFSFTDLGVFSFDLPVVVKIVNDNGNFYTFVTDKALNNITKFDFGNSLSNAIAGSLVITDNSFQSPYGIDVSYDCAAGKYIGFVANYGVSNVSVIDFGNSLSNAGNVVHTLTSPFAGPTNLNILHDADKWHLLISCQDINTIAQLIIGSNLLNTNVLTGFTGSVGTLNLPRGLSCINDSSRWYGFIANTLGSDLTRFKFENHCTANFSTSSDSIPQNIFYSGSEWHHISLAANNNGVISYFSDSTFSNGLPCVDFAYSVACLGQPVSFSDNSTIGGGTITNWQWDFGDGSPLNNSQNPVHNYIIDSTYLVTLTVTTNTGLINSLSVSVTVHAPPVALFSFLNNPCSMTSVQFNDASVAPTGDSIVQWMWNFGDASPLDNVQNPLHIFDTAGTYAVQLTAIANGGCSNVITQPITIVPAPVADFSIGHTCVGETTIFTNNSTISGGGTVSYEWDFGDSNTSTIANPTHTYPATPASYNVQLIATSTANLCSDTLLLNVRIGSKANPGFVFAPTLACVGNTVQFIDTSTTNVGDSLITAIWDFGDSNSAAGDTVEHTYLTSGVYNVTLTATTFNSCDTFITKTVTVIESPLAAFTFSSVCLDSTMYFTDNSSTPSGSVIDSIVWDFGDGSIAFGSNVSHLYADAGNYSVTQTVYNNLGCSGTAIQTVTVYDKPIASFSTNFACSGTAVNFTNLSFISTGSINSYFWDFGDSQTSVLQNPSNIYTIADVYLVTLTAYSTQGCPGTTSSSISVNPSPDFDYSDSLHCLGDTTYFRYFSLVTPDPSSQWVWNFGDGTSNSPLVNPKHKFTNSGNYNVCVTVTAINTCARTICKNVTIHPTPFAGITAPAQSCINTAISFSDNSSIASPASISHWTWIFGDNAPIDNNTNTSHIYTDDSSYTVTHIVVSDAGCSDTIAQTISIQPAPIAAFTPDPSFGSPPLEVNFINSTTGGATYEWIFGDGSAGSGDSPTHFYNDTGEYVVTMIATGSSGCTSASSGTVSVLIPFLDLAVLDVHATEINNLLTISSNLANLGNITVKKFQITTRNENGSAINEQWISANGIKPGQTYTYTFNARFEVDVLNLPSFYCVEISEINDARDSVESNNRKCAALNEAFELFDVYPNPSASTISIGANFPLAGTIELSIYNATGELMQRTSDLKVSKGYNEFTEFIGDYAKGFYAIVIRYNDQLLTKKVMKK